MTNLNLVLSMYPILQKKPVHIFIEANLSQDLAAFMEKNVKAYYNSRRGPKQVLFVRQYDSKGQLLPGILTRHKANLVAYFRRMLNDGRIYMAKQISTVSAVIDERYEDMNLVTRNDLLDYISNAGNTFFGEESKIKPFVARYPNAEEMANMVRILVEQATLFRCYSNNTSIVYTGKKNTKSISSVDDLLMALILGTAWAKLPQNSYLLS